MFMIRYAEENDREFWYTLDEHLPKEEYANKVRNQQAYVIMNNEKPIGVFRFNYFWDSVPFLNMIYIDSDYHKMGYGREAIAFWEKEMKKKGFRFLMVSTQSDEEAQHFYRKVGFKDCGSMVLDIPGYEQPLEIFMIKAL